MTRPCRHRRSHVTRRASPSWSRAQESCRPRRTRRAARQIGLGADQRRQGRRRGGAETSVGRGGVEAAQRRRRGGRGGAELTGMMTDGMMPEHGRPGTTPGRQRRRAGSAVMVKCASGGRGADGLRVVGQPRPPPPARAHPAGPRRSPVSERRQRAASGRSASKE